MILILIFNYFKPKNNQKKVPRGTIYTSPLIIYN